MQQITDTVLIFGRSLFLGEIDVKRLLSLGYTTFGINNQDFETDFVAFVDDRVAEMHERLKGSIITQSRHSIREPVIYFDNFSYYFTHDYLLKWLHGRCARAVLVGAADFVGNERYNTRLDAESAKFEPSPNSTKQSIRFIEQITDFKVYKLNPAGILNIPTISLKELEAPDGIFKA